MPPNIHLCTGQLALDTGDTMFLVPDSFALTLRQQGKSPSLAAKRGGQPYSKPCFGMYRCVYKKGCMFWLLTCIDNIYYNIYYIQPVYIDIQKPIYHVYTTLKYTGLLFIYKSCALFCAWRGRSK